MTGGRWWFRWWQAMDTGARIDTGARAKGLGLRVRLSVGDAQIRCLLEDAEWM